MLLFQVIVMSELHEATNAVDEVFRLFRDYGEDDYIGESVSKTTHSIQCGMLAERDGYPNEVIVGAFLHDIGHLVGADKGMAIMVTDGVNFGAKNHDVIGAEFLKNLSFPDTVCDIVRGHVNAKRYLVFKNSHYSQKLSSASKLTLQHQGGPMTAEEASEFEKSHLFDTILRMRSWDESGKELDTVLDPIEKFKTLCLDILTGNSK
ncbi:2-amino-1-hydroxyethylphosphonate dioxygenase (glycine-forming)-like [Gigantopelta aegis]|uniref:2-amino-1-hydroxyethylphosphonate dioxygenase (glycine-forming)-like n=1 Tax=Gigantopelta aegis TaxID=1735272 RepID=UPI001B88940C|nr:2-amino-1-hydroxyethylphosphonate dioxygenase (glycine-forming)-like [Gigantopelta aegis]